MKKDFLFDSSALLALMKSERRGDVLLERGREAPPIIDRAAIHTVQVAEVVKKLLDAGSNEQVALEWFEMLDLEILSDFPVHDALNSAGLCPRELKLSLGDRVCLSLALANGMVAVTTEEQWKTIADGHSDLGLKVMHLR